MLYIEIIYYFNNLKLIPNINAKRAVRDRYKFKLRGFLSYSKRKVSQGAILLQNIFGVKLY